MGSCHSIGAMACSKNSIQRTTNTPVNNNVENDEDDEVFFSFFHETMYRYKTLMTGYWLKRTEITTLIKKILKKSQKNFQIIKNGSLRVFLSLKLDKKIEELSKMILLSVLNHLLDLFSFSYFSKLVRYS